MDEVEPIAVVIEIPKGSRNKYEWDHELEVIKLDRFLFSSVVYPTDYGFIPDTWAEDGDPLDAMVCVSEPTFPGCVIPVNQPPVMFSTCPWTKFDHGEQRKNTPPAASSGVPARPSGISIAAIPRSWSGMPSCTFSPPISATFDS